MGRKTYEVGLREGVTSPYPTLDQYVFSTTLGESPDPAVELVSSDAVGAVTTLKAEAGKAIWICGGSRLATTLVEAGLVDEVVVKLNPILFGAGIPLLDRRLATTRLNLRSTRPYPSGHVLLEYAVAG